MKKLKFLDGINIRQNSVTARKNLRLMQQKEGVRAMLSIRPS
jgi:hypothetical protein